MLDFSRASSMDDKPPASPETHLHGLKLVRWFRAAALAFFLPPTLLLGIALLAANNVERFRDRVQEQLEFQAILAPSLSEERTEALLQSLRQDAIWEEVRIVSPQEHFRNIQGLEDWMSDEANQDIVAAMSRSLRLKPREALRFPDKALEAAQSLQTHAEVREVFTNEDAVKRLYLNFEFWKNSAVFLEWVSGVFCLLIAWLLRKLKHKILALHPMAHKSHRAARAWWLRLVLGLQKSLFFGATPLVLLSGIFVTLDYIAAPVFHAISGADPLFPVSFLPAFQSVAFWLLGAALWWIISNPMSYKAEKS
jgi:hypothetical protein